MALIKLIALAAVAPPAAPLVPRARRRAPLLRRASTQQGTLPPEESAPPDWEAMWAAGGDAAPTSAPAQKPGPVIRGVAATADAVAVDAEGWARCAATLEERGLSTRVGDGWDDDGWCRVGVDFQADVLEAHRRGMRCVFIKEEEDDDDSNDVPTSATPPAEGTQKTYTAMGSETYLQDSLLEDFADAVVTSWDEVPDIVQEWTGVETEDLSPAMFAEQLVRAAGGEDYWPRFVEEGIEDVATLKLLSEEDLKELGLPLGCRRRLLAALT